VISISGVVVSGRIEAVGANVQSFAIGDEFYCGLSESGLGGFAENAREPKKSLFRKPTGMSHTTNGRV